MPGVEIVESTISPDAGAGGFLTSAPNPYRYDGNHELDPWEVSGMIAALVALAMTSS